MLLLTVLEEAGTLPGMQTITRAVIATVTLSIFAHGITANPAIKRYARRAESLHGTAPEKENVVELPGRRRMGLPGRQPEERTENGEPIQGDPVDAPKKHRDA